MSRTSQERTRQQGAAARTSAAPGTTRDDAPLDVRSSARSLVLQAKLRVGAADDPLEREADAAAAAFASFRGAATQGMGIAAAAVEGSLGRIRRAVATDDPMGAFDVPSDLEQRIAAEQGKGAPLPKGMAQDMSSFFGADLSSVRVHRSPASAALNDEIYAKAFTVGNDVFLGRDASVSDTQLMAHELTHVVQQGGAGPMRTVRRQGKASATKYKVNTAEKNLEGEEETGLLDALEPEFAMSNTNNALSIVNDDVFAKDLSTGADLDKSIAGGTEGTKSGGAITGLVTGILGFLAAIKTVYELSKGGSPEEAVLAALEGVQNAGDIVKSAIDTAEAFGGSIAETVMPGLDLAFGCLSLLGNVAQLVRLHIARKYESKAMEDARTKGDQKLALALGNAHGKSLRKLGLTYVQLAGDIAIIVGAAAQLAAGPFGMAVKFGGAMVKLVGGFAGMIFQHFEAKATEAVRNEYAEAKQSGDKTRIEQATNARLEKDAAFAVREMVTKGVTPDPKTGEKDPNMMKLLASYGIGPAWLSKWEAAGKPPEMLLEAENMVLRFLGTDRDPKTLTQQILGGVMKVVNWFKGLFSSKPDPNSTASVAEVTAAAKKAAYPVASGYIVKKAKQGSGGVKPDSMTGEMKDTFKELTRVYGTGADPAETAERKKAIDDGILFALRMCTYPPGFDKRSIAVSNGVITFTYPYDTKTSAKAGVPVPGQTSGVTTP